jgi:hypothetical protein
LINDDQQPRTSASTEASSVQRSAVRTGFGGATMLFGLFRQPNDDMELKVLWRKHSAVNGQLVAVHMVEYNGAKIHKHELLWPKQTNRSASKHIDISSGLIRSKT